MLGKNIKSELPNPGVSDDPLYGEEGELSAIPTNEESAVVGKPPEYQIGGFSNEFIKGENKNSDNLIKKVKSRKTDDQLGITFNKFNNEFVLGTKKVYFDNNNKIRIGNEHAVTYTAGLEQLLTILTPDLSVPTITNDDIRNYIQLLKVGGVEAADPKYMLQQHYILKKLADCYKRVDPQALQHLGNKGIKIGQGLIILPSDPNELFKRLQLNIGAYNAGNKSLFN